MRPAARSISRSCRQRLALQRKQRAGHPADPIDRRRRRPRRCGRTATIAFRRPAEDILLVGTTAGWLGQSLYLREICGREEGAPPPVDLAEEKRNGDFVRGLILSGEVSTVHDISDGGLAVALAEMAIAGGVGATIEAPVSMPAHAFWFGEDQARYIVATAPERIGAILAAAENAGVACQRLGETGGPTLTLGGETAILLSDLVGNFEEWLPDYMAGAV